MYYPTESRVEAVRQAFREMEARGEEVHQEALLSILQDVMGRKTAWKAIQSLIQIGAIERSEVTGTRGHKRYAYRLRDWDMMTEEQRQEVIDLLRDLKDNVKAGMVVNLTIQNVEHFHLTQQEETNNGS